MPMIVFLWTDVALYLLLAGVLLYAWRVRRSSTLRATWGRVARDTPAMCSAVVLLAFVLVGLLDSLHYRPRLPAAPDAPAGAAVAYAPAVKSVLDGLLDGTVLSRPEKTYSSPLASHQFTKETMLIDGKPVRDFPRLRSGGAHLSDPPSQTVPDILARLGVGLAGGAAVAVLGGALLAAMLARRHAGWRNAAGHVLRGRTELPWRPMLVTFGLMCLVVGAVAGLSSGYHVLGTDRTGNDVLWQSLKSIRTALVIGSLTTIAMLPPAIAFGIASGYFKGWVDDVIQYLYTTLTSIPGVLLVAACALMMQVYIDANPDLFATSAARADLRLFLLCMILGLTGWAGLCRLLRAETLKLRELEYVQAARAFGVSHWRIMRRHLLPNVMHIVLITVVLEFSGLVLYEAVLSYLGIGVDPSMNSFGSMIDRARLEMSRDPMIWWNLLAAFAFMLALVLAANLFADAVRDAFDPRARRFRPASAPVTGGTP
ncbi:ABC transporter permease [Bordetella genomosp. 13]|uniref:ABC transporter permease n=1 Tax=Bordetella genomosp. 13 TaxID=463040 RepID=UPI0011A30862|nr:ABC transporter permease [Bordetella genomosp. 13]